MNKLKFRAFENGKMYYSDSQSDATELGCKLGGSLIGTFFNRFYGHPTLSQFTGLKDKNGKDYFFNDIVKYYDGSIGVLLNFDDCLGIGSGEINNYHAIDQIRKFELVECEIIGNIHENKDLIV